MIPAEAVRVALYFGAGGCGAVEEWGEGAALVHFEDGALIWCNTRNLSPCKHDHGGA